MKNTLAKGLLLSLMMGTSSFAMADVYIGAEFGSVSYEDEAENGNITVTQDNDYNEITIKVGSEGADGWSVEGSLSKISFDKVIFDNENDELIEIGMDAIKEFDMDSNLSPFVKFGAGFGWMDIEGYDDDTIKSFSFNIGAGLSYKITDNFAVQGGLDFVGRAWQDIEVANTGQEISTTGTGVKAYAGVNYYF